MFKNYFKIALRNLIKNKLNASINILGLAVVLAVLTVSYQSIKVSVENPIKALKVE